MAYMINTAPGVNVALEATDVFTISYPYVRNEPYHVDGEEIQADPAWKPGVQAVPMPPEGDESNFADAMGKMILTVVSIHKPGKYQLRVFYTRKWINPDGRAFGRPDLRVTTIGTFERMVRGYRYRFRIR